MTQVGLERAILRLRTERGDLCAAQQIDNFTSWRTSQLNVIPIKTSQLTGFDI